MSDWTTARARSTGRRKPCNTLIVFWRYTEYDSHWIASQLHVQILPNAIMTSSAFRKSNTEIGGKISLQSSRTVGSLHRKIRLRVRSRLRTGSNSDTLDEREGWLAVFKGERWSSAANLSRCHSVLPDPLLKLDPLLVSGPQTAKAVKQRS